MAVVDGSPMRRKRRRKSTARSSWPFSAARGDLCVLNVPQPCCDHELAAWAQLCALLPLGTSQDRNAHVAEVWESWWLLRPGGVPGQCVSPCEAWQVTPGLVWRCPNEPFADVFSDLAARFMPCLPVESTGSELESNLCSKAGSSTSSGSFT